MQGTTAVTATPKAPRPSHQSTPYGLGILRGLQGKHVYGGTVPDGVKAQRRKANRAAGRSRRINRRSK